MRVVGTVRRSWGEAPTLVRVFPWASRAGVPKEVVSSREPPLSTQVDSNSKGFICVLFLLSPRFLPLRPFDSADFQLQISISGPFLPPHQSLSLRTVVPSLHHVKDHHYSHAILGP